MHTFQMQLSDKYITFFLQGINCMKNTFAKPPFTYFKIILLQIHFAKTTLDFSVITKITLSICTFKFSKVSHKHT
jgi:hypothetical protein